MTDDADNPFLKAAREKVAREQAQARAEAEARLTAEQLNAMGPEKWQALYYEAQARIGAVVEEARQDRERAAADVRALQREVERLKRRVEELEGEE